MKKPLTSWKKTLKSLGYKVDWHQFFRNKRNRELQRHVRETDVEFHVETLEPRKMLSTVPVFAGQEGLDRNYSFGVSASNVTAEYRVLVEPGDGSDAFYVDEFEISPGDNEDLVTGDFNYTFADDGTYDIKVSLLNRPELYHQTLKNFKI